jgi:short-subunit dehydrogenase
MIDLNITALTAMTRQFVPGMVERKQGGILNVASTASFQPIPFMGVYAATKAYVLSLSEALAEELAPHGVKVSCLCPGPTETEFTAVAEFKTDITEKAPMMSAEAVAAEGLAALRAGRAVQVPGVMNALTAMSPRFLPRGLVTKVTGMLFKPNR